MSSPENWRGYYSRVLRLSMGNGRQWEMAVKGNGRQGLKFRALIGRVCFCWHWDPTSLVGQLSL